MLLSGFIGSQIAAGVSGKELLSRPHSQFSTELSFWAMYRAQDWLDQYDGVAAGNGNFEEGTSSKLIRSWVTRAGYKNLDKKISSAAKESNPTKPQNQQKVEKYSGGKKETNKLTGVMATGFDSFVHLL